MPEKPGKNREQLKEITDRIEAGIRDIFESGDMEKYRNYLRTMSVQTVLTTSREQAPRTAILRSYEAASSSSRSADLAFSINAG